MIEVSEFWTVQYHETEKKQWYTLQYKGNRVPLTFDTAEEAADFVQQINQAQVKEK